VSTDDEWMDKGACKDLGERGDNIFFPQIPKGRSNPKAYRKAKGICETCPVRVSCLAFAIAHSVSSGVWGGMTEHERKRIPKDQRIRIRRAWFSLHPLASRIRY
jgi:WhiB family redox-sensing transcriptional regulator